MAEGAPFTTDTDTEVIAHLITRELRDGTDPVAAVHKALSHLKGAFALAMIFSGYDDLMVAARQGSPLGHRLRRRRDVRRLRRDRARALHRHDRLSGGRRLGGDHARGRRAFTDRDGCGRRARRREVATLPGSWWTRAISATSWRRRFTSSPKSSAIRSRTISILRTTGLRCRTCRSISRM